MKPLSEHPHGEFTQDSFVTCLRHICVGKPPKGSTAIGFTSL